MKKYCIYLHYYEKNNDNKLPESKSLLENSEDSETSLNKITDRSDLFVESYFNCIDKINRDKKDLFDYIKDDYNLEPEDIYCEYKIIEWRENAKDTISQLEEDIKQHNLEPQV